MVYLLLTAIAELWILLIFWLNYISLYFWFWIGAGVKLQQEKGEETHMKEDSGPWLMGDYGRSLPQVLLPPAALCIDQSCTTQRMELAEDCENPPRHQTVVILGFSNLCTSPLYLFVYLRRNQIKKCHMFLEQEKHGNKNWVLYKARTKGRMIIILFHFKRWFMVLVGTLSLQVILNGSLTCFSLTHSEFGIDICRADLL